MTFNAAEYIRDLPVASDDDFLVEVRKLNEVREQMYNNAYVCRALFWGEAAALENQLVYLGNNLLPAAQRRITALESNGVLGESEDMYRFSNEDKPHVNDEIPVGDQTLELQMRRDQIEVTMRECAIGLVEAVRRHDDLSQTLGLLSFAGVKARAFEKRAATG
jgi:hypothetical protein